MPHIDRTSSRLLLTIGTMLLAFGGAEGGRRMASAIKGTFMLAFLADWAKPEGRAFVSVEPRIAVVIRRCPASATSI